MFIARARPRRRWFFGAVLVLTVACGSWAAAARGSVLITEEGAPKATILKPAGASEVVDFAAAELQEYVEKISGAKLPIRTGETETTGPAVVLDRAKLDPPRRGLECDSFTIKSEGDRLRLTGNSDRAVLYAVYAFLESLGAAWLEPGEQGEILPRKPTIAVENLNLAFRPAFDLRGMCIYDRGWGKQTIDWMGKMRMNLALYPPDGFKKRGILLMKGTKHSFAQRMGLGPNWDKDPANLKYVAMLNGKRAIPSRSSSPYWEAHAEPCMSNPEAVDMLLATSLKFIEDHPDIYLFDMRAADKSNVWCECEECQKHTPTDIYAKYINQLAARVHEKWPTKKVSLIAYFNTVFPPRDVSPDLSLGNMILWFCPISRSYRQPINSDAGGEKTIMEFPRNRARWPRTDGGWEPILRAWRKTFNGPILILDYYHWSNKATIRSSYFFARPAVFAADLRYYNELGVSGSIGVEPCPRHLPNGWNQYLKAKLLWDPSQDVAELERRYNGQFYGDCADAAHGCLAAMASVLNADRDDVESVQKLKQAAATFAAEVGACEQIRVIEKRLKRLQLWARYVILRKEYYCRLREKNADAVEKAARELLDFIESNRAEIGQYYQHVESMIPKAILQRR